MCLGGGYQAGAAGGSDTSDEWIDLDNSDEQQESVFMWVNMLNNFSLLKLKNYSTIVYYYTTSTIEVIHKIKYESKTST